MKIIVTNGKVTAEAETLSDVKVLMAMNGPKQTQTARKSIKKKKRYYTNWTPDMEKHLQKLYNEGVTGSEIARIIGTTSQSVYTKAAELRNKGWDIQWRAQRNNGEEDQTDSDPNEASEMSRVEETATN